MGLVSANDCCASFDLLADMRINNSRLSIGEAVHACHDVDDCLHYGLVQLHSANSDDHCLVRFAVKEGEASDVTSSEFG